MEFNKNEWAKTNAEKLIKKSSLHIRKALEQFPFSKEALFIMAHYMSIFEKSYFGRLEYLFKRKIYVSEGCHMVKSCLVDGNKIIDLRNFEYVGAYKKVLKHSPEAMYNPIEEYEPDPTEWWDLIKDTLERSVLYEFKNKMWSLPLSVENKEILQIILSTSNIK